MEKRTNAMIAGVVAMFVFAVLCVFQAGCSGQKQQECADCDCSRVAQEARDQIDALKKERDSWVEKAKVGGECCQVAKVCVAEREVEKNDTHKTFISAEELMLLSGKTECLFVARWNQGASLDPQGKFWSGVSYDGGYFPVLARLTNGMVKTVARGIVDGMYTVIFFDKDSLERDWRKTAYGMQEGNYDLIPAVPELCPIPAAAKKKAADKEGDDSALVGS